MSLQKEELYLSVAGKNVPDRELIFPVNLKTVLVPDRAVSAVDKNVSELFPELKKLFL